MIRISLKMLGFLSVLTALLLFSNLEVTQASAAHNIRGVAYTGNSGYIIFNCLDDGFAGRFPFAFPFPFNIPPCYNSSYGVNLDANNNFSGNAWNEAKGFVTFNASSTPTNDFRDSCHNGNTCTNANSCTACYNEDDGKVYGYMRVVAGEWIKLDNEVVNPTTQITNFEAASQPGIFSGYATSTTFGQISFNCSNDNSCTTNNYKVKIGPLEIRQMTAPNWSGREDEACSNLGAKNAVLKWNRRSGVQTGYQVIVSTLNSTSTGVIFDSYQVESTAAQVFVSSSYFNYDTLYYWFLKLWDDTGTSTAWRQFNADGITKDGISDNFARNTDKNTIDPNKTFTSYKHEFPRPSFTWTPEKIVIATTSNSFVSTSQYYNDDNVLHSCTGSVCSFLWTVTDPDDNDVLSPTSASTSIMFAKATNTIVTLTSTNDAIYTCSTSTILDINYALPLWREIKP